MRGSFEQTSGNRAPTPYVNDLRTFQNRSAIAVDVQTNALTKNTIYRLWRMATSDMLYMMRISRIEGVGWDANDEVTNSIRAGLSAIGSTSSSLVESYERNRASQRAVPTAKMFTGTPLQTIFSGLGPASSTIHHVYHTCDPNTYVLTGPKEPNDILIDERCLTGKVRYLPFDRYVKPVTPPLPPTPPQGASSSEAPNTSNTSINPLATSEGTGPRSFPTVAPSLVLNGRIISPGVLTSFTNGCDLIMAQSYSSPISVSIYIDSYNQFPNGADNVAVEQIPLGLSSYATALLPRNVSIADQTDPHFKLTLNLIMEAFGITSFSALSFPDDPQLLRRYGEIVLFVYAATL